ncbi:DNA-processing protein DprA [Cellulomonas xylanilytica]|uniref:DNA processing protein DprA n=1 Tax=Cellulomonas xylanilytica TaxID=233583 RepID=A0A510V4B1_9CELL|nr:DNA-processing protein DprA [Cellulomonas xylanilytica]GEK20741.1 DNA processing protein DprA [Cellulomonas xylanilytica]
MSADDVELLARATWSALVEPGDAVAGTLVGLLGAVQALEWVRAALRDGPDLAALEDRHGPLGDADRRRVVTAVARWAVRLPDCDPHRDLGNLDRLGGSLLVPGDPRWPSALDDLGTTAPFCVWLRGEPDLGAVLALSAAVVGSRAATSYGERVAFDLADELTAQGLCVVSGGAYGIDAAAHRGAVARGGRTLVVLAGGVDRAYPAGNARLLETVVGCGGALVSEVPPGSLPTKSRFLQRNRLIAAAGQATVVVEAAWRSGAMSTAHHAARLLRPVGAVPGPVTSMASAGCHRLLREGVAVCVTDAAEVRELAGAIGSGLVAAADAARSADDRAARRRDVLDPVSLRVVDALSRRVPTDVDRLASLAGVTVAEARGAVGLLELDGWAVRRGAGWVVAPVASP